MGMKLACPKQVIVSQIHFLRGAKLNFKVEYKKEKKTTEKNNKRKKDFRKQNDFIWVIL